MPRPRHPEMADGDEAENFLRAGKKAKLAVHELDFGDACASNNCATQAKKKKKMQQLAGKRRSVAGALVTFACRKLILVPLAVIVCVTAIYAVPFIDFRPETPRAPPRIEFDFRRAPLLAGPRPPPADKLFEGQVRAAESLAFDSAGNLFMAGEGGFVYYAHLNKSALARRQLLAASPETQASQPWAPSLVKIAELNPLRDRRRAANAPATADEPRRECPADELIYGRTSGAAGVAVSRCSKPLGVRLSADEASLYVVDTLRGLFRVNLKLAERSNAHLRLVTKLVEFRAPRAQLLPIFESSGAYINATLMAVDDLAVDSGAGARGGDVVYMTVASQSWRAVSYIFDLLEGRPSGLVVRYDTGSGELSVLDPHKLANVRTAPLDERADNSTSFGSPRLDANDLFDERPLFFPNGIQLTDDRSALLIADTSNRRVLKHFVRGPRAGNTDHFAWTPNSPDNIRRSHDKSAETYWLVGCGESRPRSDKWFDALDTLMAWPSLRKLLAKSVYALGATLESVGSLTGYVPFTDFGYTLKTGERLTPSFCPQMIAVKYSASGEILRAVHSDQLARSEMSFFSQVDELVEGPNNVRALYAGSPLYDYLVRFELPADE